ncbi:HIT zinc finger [Popillia japonica]|uniref:Box C/D snoRNA protein 1 n=1 Tax=Popillia japonica TaxID=7064 RepID=A0AAW1NII4_POPJA
MEIETSIEESTQPSTSKSIRLGNCEVCMSSDAKYTCPKCEVKFCSLRCSTIHKKELDCDGIRDRTKFIPINKFTNLDLSSDYRLLEEIGRRIETYKRELKKPNYKSKHAILPHFLHKLRISANKRHTKLKFLPDNFIRHKENTTRLNFHKDVIFWRIDWIFSNADKLKLVDEKVRESEKIASVLQKYFVKQENEVLQEKLQYYQALGLSGIKVFLKAEEKAGDKYYELDISESLSDNLRGKVIIEYPTMIVVNKEHSSCFEVIDSDDEDKMDVVKAEAGSGKCGD